MTYHINKLLIPFALLITVVSFSCKDSKKEEVKEENIEEEIIKSFELKGEEVTYSSDTTQMKGYIAYNKNADSTNPGIIVVHEWWGHNDYSRKRAEMLAELGYTALAVDMYGDGKLAEHPSDAGKFATMVMSNTELAEARFDAAMKTLKSHPTVDSDKIAAIGYCFGGSVVLTMANIGKDLDAVAAFHSGVELPVMPGEKLASKILVINGKADPMVTEKAVTNFKQALDSINADYKYISYEGVKHAFTSKAADSLGSKFNLPLEYNAEADEKSWEELKMFLSKTFDE